MMANPFRNMKTNAFEPHDSSVIVCISSMCFIKTILKTYFSLYIYSLWCEIVWYKVRIAVLDLMQTKQDLKYCTYVTL